MEQPSLYTIRPMEPGDIPAVVAIDRLSFPTPWPPSSYLFELSHNKRSFYHVLLKPETTVPVSSGRGWRRLLHHVVDSPDRNRVSGYVGFRLQGTSAHISTIAVHPDLRGRGLGELLLLTAIEEALGLQIGSVTLEVRASNLAAQCLYHKYGFQFTGTHRGYYQNGEDAWLMAVGVGRNGYLTRVAGLRRILEARLRSQQQNGGQNDGHRL